VRVQIYPDPSALSEAAADLVAEAISDPDRDHLSLGLSGGSTPIAMYRLLRERRLPWHKVDAWMSDERWVPSDHPECNGHQAATELMDHVHARLHRPRWAPWMTPADSADSFEEDLRALHPDGRADLILLGMGADGHTASLFPGTAALDAPPERWFVHNHVPQLDTDRLTTTFTFLRAAHRVVFLVAGEGKAEALRQVLEPREGEEPLPAARVMGGQAEVTWLVDAAAASLLAHSAD
jgi:6-phosphogluconolactonase